MTAWVKSFRRKKKIKPKIAKPLPGRESVWDCLVRNGHTIAIADHDKGYFLDGRAAAFRELKALANVYKATEGGAAF